MKENFPNLAKETEFQEVQEAQTVPKKLDPKRNILRHIIVKLPKIKDREFSKQQEERKALLTKECP